MMKIRSFFLLLSCLFALASNTMANLAEGIAAYKQGNMDVALKELTPEAERGNAEAQLYLGQIYDSPLDGKQDGVAAFNWYEKAANQGNHIAQEIVGTAYLNGRGVTKDVQVALKWLRLSADQGNGLAMQDLALAYQNGLGVNTDKVLAFALYNLATFSVVSLPGKRVPINFRLSKELTVTEVKKSWDIFCVLGPAKSLISALDAYVENPKSIPADACPPKPKQ